MIGRGQRISNQASSSERSEEAEGVNLQKLPENMARKQQVGRQSFRMIMSKCYEQKIFGTNLAIAENFFQHHESNPQSQLNFEEQEAGNQNKNLEQKQKVPKKKMRFCTTINTSLKSRQRHMNCVKGKRYQTRNICKKLFSEISKFLRMIADIHVLNDDQRQVVEKFLSSKTRSFTLFQQLFKCKQLKLRCMAYFKSTQFVSSILLSKATIKGKLTFLKYLERIRKIPSGVSITKFWKR